MIAAINDIEDVTNEPGSYKYITVNLTIIKGPHINLMNFWKTQPLEHINSRDELQAHLDMIRGANAVTNLLTPCAENRTGALYSWFYLNATHSKETVPFLQRLVELCDYNLIRFNNAAKLMMLHALEAIIYDSICTAARFPSPQNETIREPILANMSK